jgi:hypothetical protein
MISKDKLGLLFDALIAGLGKLPEEEQRLFIVQLMVRLKAAGFDKILEELK